MKGLNNHNKEELLNFDQSNYKSNSLDIDVSESIKLKTSIKHTLPLVFKISKDGNITISERGTIPISHNLSDDEFGISAFELYKNYPDIVEGIKSVLEGKVYWDTCEFDGPNGKKFLEFYSTPEININGEIEGAIGMVVDITSSKEAAEVLRKSEEKYRDLVENTKDWVWEVDKDYKYTYCNQRVRDIIGYQVDEVIGKTPFDFMDKREAERIQTLLDNLKCTESIDLELVCKTKHGNEVIIDTKGVPVFYSKNNLVGFRGIGRDITERTRYTEALKNNESKLIEINKNKDRLFSIISHDLKNPAQALLAHSRMLHEDFSNLSSDEIKESILSVYSSSQHLFEMLDGILNWTRTQSNGINPSPMNIDIYSKINTVIDFYNQSLEDKKILLNNKVDKNLIVYADQEMIYTIIRNLIGNAIKYSYEGGEILVSSLVEGNYLTICVKDRGCGISEETLEKLFSDEPIESQYGTKNEKGTGLGLIICKDFVEKHKGKIWVNSKIGEGSKFCFTIPIKT